MSAFIRSLVYSCILYIRYIYEDALGGGRQRRQRRRGQKPYRLRVDLRGVPRIFTTTLQRFKCGQLYVYAIPMPVLASLSLACQLSVQQRFRPTRECPERRARFLSFNLSQLYLANGEWMKPHTVIIYFETVNLYRARHSQNQKDFSEIYRHRQRQSTMISSILVLSKNINSEEKMRYIQSNLQSSLDFKSVIYVYNLYFLTSIHKCITLYNS